MSPTGVWTNTITVPGIYDAASIAMQFRLYCDQYYYTASCNVYCKPRDDNGGHYTCNSDGTKNCRSGWTNPNNNCLTGEETVVCKYYVVFCFFFYQHATNLMHVYYSCGSTSSNCNLFCYYSHLCYWVCQWELCSARTMCVSASNIFLTLPISHDVVTYIGAPVDGRDSSAISVFPNQDAVSNTVFCRTITSTAQLSFLGYYGLGI